MLRALGQAGDGALTWVRERFGVDAEPAEPVVDAAAELDRHQRSLDAAVANYSTRSIDSANAADAMAPPQDGDAAAAQRVHAGHMEAATKWGTTYLRERQAEEEARQARAKRQR